MMTPQYSSAARTLALTLMWLNPSNRANFWKKLPFLLFQKCSYRPTPTIMESPLRHTTISISENCKACSPIQVLQVHKGSLNSEQDVDYFADGVYVCHASLIQAIRQISTQSKHLDAVIVAPECTVSDILAIREVTTKKVVPLILHTLKYDWKTKEIALESGADEYHIGFLDERFAKRVRLIKKIKSM